MARKRVKREAAGLEKTIERDAAGARLARLRSVADSFKGFRHAKDVLTLVRAVPTIFADFDRATKVGGLPTERITLLHGESAGGKTSLALGLIMSFLARDHFALMIDAERTTPASWVRQAYGELAEHPYFFAERPDTYEEIRAKVREFCSRVRDARAAKLVPPDTTAIIVLDSIRKLIPKDQFQMIMIDAKKIASGGITPEAARSRITQIKAQMSAAWTDELVPLLERSGVALVVIAREIEDPDNTNDRARKAGTAVKTTGGKAWFYDASLDLRSSKAGVYGKEIGEEGDEKKRMEIWGRRYCVEITKTKVSGEGEEYRAKCFFHVSNGKKSPKGFDRAKDLFELGKRSGALEVAGSWFKLGSKKWQGEERALAGLQDPALLAELERRARATFKLEETR